MTLPTSELFLGFLNVMKKLRNPDLGCPWDIEQTHQSIRPYLIEEAYEVLQSIDEKDDQALCSELGDLLLQVIFHANIAEERGAFTLDDVLTRVTEKMIRRHPHVFGTTTVKDSSEVLRNWENIKQQERIDANEHSSVLSGIPNALPSLNRAQRIGEKAAKANFDWASFEGVWEKINEEKRELEAEIRVDNKAQIEQEFGDFLFSLCQAARWLRVSAEDCLREACNRFVLRFHHMESLSDKPLGSYSEEELEELWQKAKRSLPPGA